MGAAGSDETADRPPAGDPASSAPGWYPNPLGGKRYWNGSEWTGSRPSPASAVGLFLGGGLLLGYGLLLGLTVLTSDECVSDGGQLECVGGGIETTVNVPLLIVVSLIGLALVAVAVAAWRRWLEAGRQATRGGSVPAPSPAAPPSPASPPPVAPAPAPPAPAPTATTDTAGTEEETIPSLEQFIRSSVDDHVTDPHALEWQRSRAVVAIDRMGGPEAIAALVRLLDLDTGYRPRLSAPQATMGHEVIARLGASGAPEAVEPLLVAFDTHRQAGADDLCRATVEALALLGDRRALPALTAAATDKTGSRGLRKAAATAVASLGGDEP